MVFAGLGEKPALDIAGFIFLKETDSSSTASLTKSVKLEGRGGFRECLSPLVSVGDSFFPGVILLFIVYNKEVQGGAERHLAGAVQALQY